MSRFRISQAAEDDLDLIWGHVAADSPDDAAKLMRRLANAFARLAEFPGIGLNNDAVHPGFLRFPVGKYVVYFDVGPDLIEIVRVLHAARDIERIVDSD